MNSDLFMMFAQAGNKVLFQYNLDNHRFDYISPVVENILGLGVKEIQENPELLFAKVQEDEREAIANRWRELPETKNFCMTIRFGDGGKTKYLQVEGQLLQSPTDNTAVLAGMAEDVTEEAEYENYILEYARRKNTVLALVAHDLKAPLAHIQGASSLLRDSRLHSSSETEKLFAIIDQACNDSIRLIADVLHDEHVRSPVIICKKDRINVPEMIDRILTSFRASNQLQHQMIVECPEDKIIAELDEVKFSQIMNNLIMNSVKFTPPGGQIIIRVIREGNELRIIHSDTGIGIPEELQPFVFERYNNAGRSGLRGEASTGVGLSIVRQLVELQGGKVWVESKPGSGATFFVTFPLS